MARAGKRAFGEICAMLLSGLNAKTGALTQHSPHHAQDIESPLPSTFAAALWPGHSSDISCALASTTAAEPIPDIIIGIVAEIAARINSALMSTQTNAKIGLETRITKLEHQSSFLFKYILRAKRGIVTCFPQYLRRRNGIFLEISPKSWHFCAAGIYGFPLIRRGAHRAERELYRLTSNHYSLHYRSSGERTAPGHFCHIPREQPSSTRARFAFPGYARSRGRTERVSVPSAKSVVVAGARCPHDALQRNEHKGQCREGGK